MIALSQTPFRWRLASLAIAGLLFISAGMKATAEVPAPAPFGLPALGTSIATLIFELLLGVWLVSGRSPGAAWVASFVTFVGFTALSLVNAWNRVECCGCFGDAEIPAWWIVRLDVAVLIVLGLAKPSVTWRVGLLGVATLILLSLVSTTGVAAWLSSSTGSADIGWASLRGRSVVSETLMLDFGERPGGAFSTTDMTVINRGQQSMTLLGMKTDCSMSTASDFPMTLAPGESAVIRAALKFPADPGHTTRLGMIYVDAPGHPPITFRLCGRSAGSPTSVSKGPR